MVQAQSFNVVGHIRTLDAIANNKMKFKNKNDSYQTPTKILTNSNIAQRVQQYTWYVVLCSTPNTVPPGCEHGGLQQPTE